MICPHIAAWHNNLITVSACTDSISWVFYVTSYASSEPHIIGSFAVP